MTDYKKRIVDDELALRLEAFGAVQIKGPKWCGKNNNRNGAFKKLYKVAGS